MITKDTYRHLTHLIRKWKAADKCTWNSQVIAEYERDLNHLIENRKFVG